MILPEMTGLFLTIIVVNSGRGRKGLHGAIKNCRDYRRYFVGVGNLIMHQIAYDLHQEMFGRGQHLFDEDGQVVPEKAASKKIEKALKDASKNIRTRFRRNQGYTFWRNGVKNRSNQAQISGLASREGHSNASGPPGIPENVFVLHKKIYFHGTLADVIKKARCALSSLMAVSNGDTGFRKKTETFQETLTVCGEIKSSAAESALVAMINRMWEKMIEEPPVAQSTSVTDVKSFKFDEI